MPQGTDLSDVITGSPQNDDIQALGGRDEVSARRGDDFVFGSRGHDDISGGVGGDRLVGGFGPDDIDGGPGTTDVPRNTFECQVRDPGGRLVASVEANQVLFGGDDKFMAAGCEVVFRPSTLQSPGAAPEAEVTITTPEGTITMTP